MAQEAVQRAALEDPADVHRMMLIDRGARTLDGKGGGLHWKVRVASQRESAEIFFDGDAKYVGADLAGTLRMRNQNLLAGGQDFADMLSALRAKVGEDTPLAFLRVAPKQILLRTDDKQFDANIVGVSDSTGLFFCHGMTDMLAGRFGFGSVDWSLLPTIADRARTAVTVPQPIVVAVALSVPQGDNIMDMGRVRAANLRWAVSLKSGYASYARAVFDRTGTLIGVKPWDGRQGCD